MSPTTQSSLMERLQCGLIRQRVNAVAPVFVGCNFELRFEPTQEPLYSDLHLLVQLGHLLGQRGKQILDNVALCRMIARYSSFAIELSPAGASFECKKSGRRACSELVCGGCCIAHPAAVTGAAFTAPLPCCH